MTFALEAVDPPGEEPQRWTVGVSATGVTARRGPAPGDVAVRVRGAASDLYLLAWHRRPLEGLEVEGPAELFEQLWGAHGVTWA